MVPGTYTYILAPPFQKAQAAANDGQGEEHDEGPHWQGIRQKIEDSYCLLFMMARSFHLSFAEVVYENKQDYLIFLKSFCYNMMFVFRDGVQ